MNITLPYGRLLLQCNFASIITLILLMAFIITNVSFTKHINVKFFLICAATTILSISDNIRFYTYHLTSPNIWRYLSAATGYTVRPLIIFLFYIVVLKSRKRVKFLLVLPIILNGIIAYLSCIPALHGLMFSYNEANHYVRGILGYLPYFVSAIYVFLLIHNISKRNFNNKSEAIVVFLIIFFAILATFIESIFKYDLILSEVMILSTVFYYLFLNVQVFKRDTLTQLENRRCFYLQVKKLKKSDFIILSMDLNNLKNINDLSGHNAGDDALVLSVEYMRKFFTPAGLLYRTGGDEFMCIFKKNTEFEVKQMISNFQTSLEITNLQVACGFSTYHHGDDIDKIISQSDSEMYKNKTKLKKKNQ